MKFTVVHIKRPTYRPPGRPPEPAPAPPAKKPDPLAEAFMALQGRLVEKPSGYWLDGLPASLNTIMRACNKVRKSMGLEQIAPCARWRV